MATILNKVTDKIPWLHPKETQSISDDLRIEEAGIKFDQVRHEMDAIWLKTIEREAGITYPGYRVIRLLQLKFIPMDVRRNAGLLQKMRTALRGMYGSGVNLVYLAAGIYTPPVGIVQCYGVSAFDVSLEGAERKSQRDLVVLKSALAGAYRQTAWSL